MSAGKSIRYNSIFRPSDSRAVVVAIDHGGIAGPIEGIEKPEKVLASCIEGGADAILTTRGFVKATEGLWDRSTSLILRLTGGFTVLGGKFEEEMISTVETALLYGASGVAVTVKFGHEREGEFIKQASLVADTCERWGLPLMIEVMARGNGIEKPNDPKGIKLAARAAQEIGADIIKTYYTGTSDTFREVVDGCPAPILILGGEKTSDIRVVLQEIYDSVKAGGMGVAIGRNIWQQKDAKVMVEAVCGIVHEGWSVNTALELLSKAGIE